MQRAFTELASYHTYMAEHSVCDCRLCAQQCCYPLCENSRFLAEGIPDVPVGWSGATKLTASSHLAFSALFALRIVSTGSVQVQAQGAFVVTTLPVRGAAHFVNPLWLQIYLTEVEANLWFGFFRENSPCTHCTACFAKGIWTWAHASFTQPPPYLSHLIQCSAS